MMPLAYDQVSMGGAPMLNGGGGDFMQMGVGQPMYPMAMQNYNNVAAASFYSHLPFGRSSGYMSTFA